MTSKSRRISTETPKPNAWVVNGTDRGRKSVKLGNKIYLQDGQEFQIELHNPLTESVLADIRVNGSSVSKTGIVIRPAQRFYLDCFVDDKKKFIFKTYEVEDTSESKQSISKNGTIEVYFYKEETFSIKNWTNKFDRIIEKYYYPMYYPQYYPNYPIYPLNPMPVIWFNNTSEKYQNTIGGYTTNNIIGSSNTSSTNNNSNIFSSSINSNVSLINDGSFNTSSLNNLLQANYSSGDSNSLNEVFNTKMETGRVEKGEESKQEFTDVDLEFQKYHISSVLYQILPESQKPVETTEIKKKFCDECGSKVLKDTSKFCHECGTDLNKITNS
jgi:hypothetical protein